MSFYDYTVEENILRYFTKLHQVEIEYESRWGIAKLPNLVSPELKAKWDTQIQKLWNAKKDNKIDDVAQLVEGCIRAYAIMEKEALGRGHKMHNVDCWDVKHPESGQVYRIVKNNYDAGIEEGVRVYTLQEVARILEKKDTINKVKGVFPDAKVFKIEGKDFFNDDLPF